MRKKTCSQCGKTKRLTAFHLHGPSKDGRKPRCKGCRNEYQKNRNHTAAGRAANMWTGMNQRVRHQPEYRGVNILISRSAFIAWAAPLLEKWFAERPNETPSVDRIRGGDYVAGNLRIIAWGENARLAFRNHNVHAPVGQAWCSTCEQYKPTEDFHANASRHHGLQNRCRACRHKPRKNVTWKNLDAPPGKSWCGKCRQYLPKEDFYPSSTAKLGLQSSCKGCQQARAKQRNAKRKAATAAGSAGGSR